MMGASGRAPVLAETIGPAEGAGLWAKQAALVVLGVAVLAIAAKVKVPVWPSPVPITLQSFVVLTVGAAYGLRLGAVTMLAYLLVGAIGFDVFTNSSAERNGLGYMLGGTGGYLAGYLLAVVVIGAMARRGLDRSLFGAAAAMFVGTAIIYALGVPWLYHIVASGGLFEPAKYASVLDQTLQWGFYPFLIGDAIKLALAALTLPLAWRLVGAARR